MIVRTVTAAALCAALGFSQEYRGRIEGSVTDPTQAAVMGSKITLRNVATGTEESRDTDALGKYRFDFVLPGTYTVTAELAGFSKTTREGIVVQTRGDVTVDIQLAVGNVTESVTVAASGAQVEFNTSTMNTTVSGQLLKDVPILARNPFTLALLNPAVINRYWDVAHRNPFYMWSSNGLDVGGATGGKNDMLLDGVPLGYAARGSYNAPMDAVQEVSVQQNSVDAEFGFSAGGVLNLSMKTGTNDWHGLAYYFGRNPKLNAMTNRIVRSPSVVRNHTWGGNFSNPIKKNKIFSFFTYEGWQTTQPQTLQATLPTDLERQGNFSQSLRRDGSVRPIYDPLTTQFNAATGAVTRMPFAGNVLPQNRISPTGQRIINDLWKPRGAGQDATGINNYSLTYSWWIKYWNLSERVDWNINDAVRTYFRFSKYETRLDNPNHGGTIAVRSDNGGVMDALNSAGDVVWMINPNTTFNFRLGATYLEDDYDSQWAQVPESVWSGLWQNSNWYKPVLAALPAIYYPQFNFQGNGGVTTGRSGWWQVHGRVLNFQSSISQARGRHNYKVGWQLRHSWDDNGSPGPGQFIFNAVDTGESFNAFDASRSGNMFASALLGVVNGGNANINPLFQSNYQQWGLFFQDDIKVNRRVTLNLGLRWELETAPRDKNLIFSRFLDLNNPIPEFQGAGTPQMPAQVTAISNVNYRFNGAWNFTDENNPRVYPNLSGFLPRLGVAIRISDTSALRVGYARYAVPMKGAWTEGFSIPRDGFSENTGVLGALQGVPRTNIDNPFPAENPVRDPVGKGRGRYTNMGNAAGWFYQDAQRPVNDRFNFSYQHMLPGGLVTDTTYFMNFGKRILGPSMWGGDFNINRNLADPNLRYEHKGLVDASVPNPFFGLLDTDRFPGNLRTQRNVPVSQLLRPYPQYGNLSERLTPDRSNRYYALQLKVERSFSNGLSFIFGYNYNREYRDEWFDDRAQFANTYSSFDTRSPRHNLRLAGTYELPFGRGRRFGSSMHPVAEAVLGGWSTSHIYMFNNGSLLTFGTMQATGDPKIDNPTPAKWFETSGFSRQPAYTPRSNPWYYDGLRGPGFWQLDSTLSKNFRLTERFGMELRMEFYNLTNSFIPSNPNVSVTSSTFGRSTSIFGGNYGREIQYNVRFRF
ncbi:MAG: TonB-dependent receptor [Bryobacteraceae bacterium]